MATTMSPFALAMLGMDSTNVRSTTTTTTTITRESTRPSRQAEQTFEVMVAGMPQATRPLEQPRAHQRRRATSHYNIFQTVCSSAQDAPPAYALAASQRPVSPRHCDNGREILPGYSCSVAAESKLLMNVEALNPLHIASESEWKEVYMVLRGTMLSLHRLKDGGQGKLLRTYTLQHAEIGLATDMAHTVLIPQTRLAHLIPSATRRRAWQKDPDMFRPVRQTIMRLRLETDQILLADASEEHIFSLIRLISAGIDVAPSIDERSVPKQCTVPRRRRRPRQQPNGDINDTSLVAEQERLFRQMYPQFAEGRTSEPQEMQPLEQTLTEPPQREEDDLDFSAMREDDDSNPSSEPTFQSIITSTTNRLRPTMTRQTTTSTIGSTYGDEMFYETSPTNFAPDGKWAPPHTRTEAQMQRYTRRCMPILLAEAVRASDVLICHGRRVKINWRMQLLEEWQLQPPTYKSHAFPKPRKDLTMGMQQETTPGCDGGSLERSSSTASSGSRISGADAMPQQSLGSMLGGESDVISPAGEQTTGLDLSKISSVVADKMQGAGPRAASLQLKSREAHGNTTESHGVIFCF